MEHHKIIIVGGGLSGLGVAKRLNESGEKFKIITETIGGRVKTSPDGQVNYGAYFVTADCKNVMPYIEKVSLVHFAKAHFHNGKDHYNAYSPRIIKHIPAGVRLLIELIRFRSHVQKIRKKAINIPYEHLIESDSYIKKCYHQKAGEFIKDHGLEKLVKEYFEQFLWAAYFTDPREVSTAVFLSVLMTLIVPSYSFKFNFDKLVKPFAKDINIDSVTQIQRLKNNEFELKTKSNKIYQCKTLVLATPMNITNKLIKSQKINGGINVNYYHVKGKVKKEYDVSWYNFFPIKEEALISREHDGTYLYFYGRKDNIAKYFDEWEVITKDSWKPALFFLGDNYINQNPELNLYLANDHDVAGTEDSLINGQYIAGLVLKGFRM